jgi:hypothetical protein
VLYNYCCRVCILLYNNLNLREQCCITIVAVCAYYKALCTSFLATEQEGTSCSASGTRVYSLCIVHEVSQMLFTRACLSMPLLAHVLLLPSTDVSPRRLILPSFHMFLFHLHLLCFFSSSLSLCLLHLAVHAYCFRFESDYGIQVSRLFRHVSFVFFLILFGYCCYFLQNLSSELAFP